MHVRPVELFEVLVLLIDQLKVPKLKFLALVYLHMSSNHKMLRWKSNHPHSPGPIDGPNGLRLGMNPAIG